MIIIPERKLVLILVPRTGSGSLRRAVLARYPQAMQIYRHMEADGVPAGYDRWARWGVVREPVARLWSLYKFLGRRGGAGDTALAHPDHFNAMWATVQRPFEDWLLHNEAVFTSPYDSAYQGRFFPQFMVRHALPENRKSQFIYLRPDLGTLLWTFADLAEMAAALDVTLPRHNETDPSAPPALAAEASAYVQRVFGWDAAMTGGKNV